MQNLSNNAYFHSVVSIVLFGVSYLLMQGGAWQSLTLGAILNGLYHSLMNWNNGLTAGGAPKYNA